MCGKRESESRIKNQESRRTDQEYLRRGFTFRKWMGLEVAVGAVPACPPAPLEIVHKSHLRRPPGNGLASVSGRLAERRRLIGGAVTPQQDTPVSNKHGPGQRQSLNLEPFISGLRAVRDAKQCQSGVAHHELGLVLTQ